METILKISNLSKSFARNILNRSGDKVFESTRIIDDLNLDIYKNETCCIIGGNGAGKSSLLNLIQNYTKANYGHISYFVDDKKINLARVASHNMNKIGIGRLFQNKLVFKELSVIDNMILGAFKSDKSSPLNSIFRRNHILKYELDLKNKAISIWHELLGSDNFLIKSIDKLAGSLSYGQQRILAISRLLMGNYRLVILDEPTSGIDIEFIEVVKTLVKKLKSNQITVLIVEHNMEFVLDVSDRVLWLDAGKIRIDGTREILLKDQGFKNFFL